MKPVFKNTSWYKVILNRYIVVLSFFIVWMLFFDNYSLLDHHLLDKEMSELENNKKYYQEEIRKDSKQIKKLKRPFELEKYAREKYFMKKENEDIYIIELEEDLKEK